MAGDGRTALARRRLAGGDPGVGEGLTGRRQHGGTDQHSRARDAPRDRL